MKNLVRVVLMGFMAVLLNGCAEFDVRSGYQVAPTSGKGVLAVGLSANDEMPNFYWRLRKIGTTETKDITLWTIHNPPMWENPKGRLAIVELDQGDYELFDWQVVLGFAPTQYFRIPFSVRAGRVTYLGRLHLNLDRAQMRFDVNTTQNKFTDDYAVLREKIPNISSGLIDQTEAVFQTCADANCKKPLSETVKRTIVIPIVIKSR